jgi:hypothetical protein
MNQILENVFGSHVCLNESRRSMGRICYLIGHSGHKFTSGAKRKEKSDSCHIACIKLRMLGRRGYFPKEDQCAGGKRSRNGEQSKTTDVHHCHHT